MFDEIKAKLGLDITSFQRGLAASQKDLSKFQENARGKLMSFFAPATILAGIASVISKAQELRDKAIEAGEAFSDSVRQTAEMGDNIDRAKNFLFELAAKGLAAYQSRIENVTAAVIALFNPKLTREQILKNLQEQKKLEAQGKAADKEAEKREKDRAEKEKKDIQEIGKNFKAAADEREKRSFDELSTAEKIKQRKQELVQAEKDYNNAQKTGVERSAAKASAEKLRTEIKNLETQQTNEIKDAEKNLTKTRRQGAMIIASDAKKLELLKGDVLDAEKELAAAGDDQLKKKQAENKLQEAKNALLAEAKRISDEASTAEKKKTDEIAKDLADLTDKADKLKKELAESKRQAELPTMAEVASGQRDIGVRSREDAKKLAAEEAKIKKLSDNETRLKGQLANAKTAGDRKNIIEEGRRNREQLDAARARADALRKGLAGKVSDVPFAEQEAAAEAARKEAEAAAEAERNKPKPKPDGKPTTPPSASEAASNAATGAIGKAQQNLTSTAPKPAAGGAGDIATNVSNCVKILGEIKDRLDPTSISTT